MLERISDRTMMPVFSIILYLPHPMARACGIPAVGVPAVALWQWRSGYYSHQSFPLLLFSDVTFSRIRTLIWQGLLRMAKNIGVDTFPDPVRHFGAPWRPFWILQAVRRCRRWARAPFAARLVFYNNSLMDPEFRKKMWKFVWTCEAQQNIIAKQSVQCRSIYWVDFLSADLCWPWTWNFYTTFCYSSTTILYWGRTRV